MSWSLDRKFYILGFSAGSSRRKASSTPHECKNTGGPPKIEWTSDRVKSLAIGIMVGHNYIFECKTIKTNAVVTENPLVPYIDMISVTAPTTKVKVGDTVKVPISLTRQAKEKYGTKMAQILLNYNADYFECTSVEQSAPWVENFAYDVEEKGKIIVQVERAEPTKDDTFLFYATFKVLKEGYGKYPLSVVGSAGTGMGTELLVVKEDGELYYITPTNFESGYFDFGEAEQPTILGSQDLPTEGSSYIGSGGSSLDFNFDADLSFPSGFTPSGAISVVISAYLNGQLIGSTRVPMQGGSHSYEGGFDLKSFEPIQEGSLSIDMRVECEKEEDAAFVYVYIKAGALFKIVTKVTKKEEALGLPPERVVHKPTDDFIVVDDVIFRVIKGREPINLLLSDLITIQDSHSYATCALKRVEVIDIVTLLDLVKQKHFDPTVPQSVKLLLSDTVGLTDEEICNILSTLQLNEVDLVRVEDASQCKHYDPTDTTVRASVKDLIAYMQDTPTLVVAQVAKEEGIDGGVVEDTVFFSKHTT